MNCDPSVGGGSPKVTLCVELLRRQINAIFVCPFARPVSVDKGE